MFITHASATTAGSLPKPWSNAGMWGWAFAYGAAVDQKNRRRKRGSVAQHPRRLGSPRAAHASVFAHRRPSSQWRSAQTTNAIKRLHEEFKRHIKTQTVRPSAETAAMLVWVLLASGEIATRKVYGWHALASNRPILCPLTSPPNQSNNYHVGMQSGLFHHVCEGTGAGQPFFSADG